MRPTDTQIAKVAGKFVEAKYYLGDSTKGWDCLSMLVEFYSQLGVELPKEYKGFTLENYGEKWKLGQGRSEFLAFMSTLGEEVKFEYALSGDLLVFDYGEVIAPGIYLGNAHVLCAYEKGVYIIPLKFIKKFLVGVRRCLT